MNISDILQQALGLTGLNEDSTMPELARKKLMAEITEKNVAGYIKMLSNATDEEMVAEVYKRFDARDLQRLVLILVLTGSIQLEEKADVDDEEKPKTAKGGKRGKTTTAD